MDRGGRSPSRTLGVVSAQLRHSMCSLSSVTVLRHVRQLRAARERWPRLSSGMRKVVLQHSLPIRLNAVKTVRTRRGHSLSEAGLRQSVCMVSCRPTAWIVAARGGQSVDRLNRHVRRRFVGEWAVSLRPHSRRTSLVPLF